MKTIFAWLLALFASPRTTAAERFVASKHPQNTAEVEHWTRVYERSQEQRFFNSCI